MNPMRMKKAELIERIKALEEELSAGKAVAATGVTDPGQVLEVERRLLRSLIDLVPDSLYVKDRESRFLVANKALARIHCVATPEEILGTSDADFYPPQVAAAFRADEEQVLTGQSILDKEEQFENVDGKHRVLLTSKVPLADPQGTIIGLVGIGHDITARKATEQALRESKERIRSIVSNLPALVWEAWGSPDDSNLRHGFVSDYVETMLGYTTEEWLSAPDFWLSTVHPDDRARVIQENLAIFGSGKKGSSRFRMKTKDGRLLWVETHFTIICDSSGHPVGARGLTMDISERRWSELWRNLRFAAIQALSESHTLASAAPPILQALCEGLDWDIGELWSVDSEAGVLRRTAAWHSPSNQFPAFDAVPPGKTQTRGSGLAGRVWASGSPAWIEDIAHAPRVANASAAVKDGMRSAFAYPIKLDREVLGVLTFYARAEQENSSEELQQTVSAVGVLIAQFMDRHRTQDALQQSESRFRKIFENVATGIAITDMEARFQLCNPAYCTLLGYSEEEFREIDFSSLVHPDDRAANLAEIRQLQAGDIASFEIENRYVHKSGATVWGHKYVSILRDEKGRPMHLLALVTDVSERIQTEKRLQHLNEVLHSVREVEELMLRERNPERILSQACDILARTRDYQLVWIGQTDPTSKRVVPRARAGRNADYLSEIIVTWDEKPTGRGPIGMALRERKTRVCQNTATDPDFAPWREAALARGYGSVAAVPLIYGSRLFGVIGVYADRAEAFDPEELQLLDGLAGNLAFALQSIEDEMQRRQMEEELRKSENQLRILSRTVEQSPSSVVITDTDGNIQYVNPKFTQLTGYSLEEVREQNPRVLKSGQTPLETYQELWATLLAGRDWQGQFCNVKKNGELYWEHAVISPVKDESGVVRHYVAIKEDVTERRRLEQEVLDTIENEQRRFGQDLHDDLCQHLAGLQFLSGVLAKSLAEKALPEAADASRISDCIRETFDRARMLAHGLSPAALESAGLAGALLELAENVARMFQIGCDFHCDVPVSIEDIGVATHLYRIVQEAINNAVRHGQAKHVAIRLTASPEHCNLVIEDDGCGFSTTSTHHRGMGLRVMKYRATMIGATLDVTSSIGKGTKVTCSLGLACPKR